MQCKDCQSWLLKNSKLARHQFAPCAHMPIWEFMPGVGSCQRYKAASQEVQQARAAWFANVMAVQLVEAKRK